MNSSLWIDDQLPTATTEDLDTGEQIAVEKSGYIQVGTVGDGSIVIHAAPGLPAPSETAEAVTSSQGWQWSDIIGLRADLVDLVLETVVELNETDDEGNPVIVREKIAERKSRADVKTILSNSLPPHQFLGEQR